MKKVVLASLLACATIASGLPSASAQTPVSLGTQAQGAAANAPIQMSDPELAAYNNAKTQPTPQAQAAAFEAYLTAYPQSQVKVSVLETLISLYSSLSDVAKTIDAADRTLAVDPNDLTSLYAEALLRKGTTDSITDATAKQAAFDAAASYAQKGLTAFSAPKPAAMADADFTALKARAVPAFYGVIAAAAVNKKDTAAAIDAYKKELASVPVAQTTQPNGQLPDTYALGTVYLSSTPPDYLNCAYYMARFVAYAPEPYKSQVAPTAKSCYRHYHGGDDGYDAVQAVAQANLNPPASFAGSVKPAPTPAEQIHTIITTTTDLGTLAIADKEMVFQYGSPEDAGKVWDTIKGKSSQFPDVLVVESSPTVLKVAVTDTAIATKTADFTFNMTPPEEPATKQTAVQIAAAKKKADAIAAATAVGSKVTLTGTYDSFSPSPLMIVMKDGEVVLPKATPAKAPVKPAAHPAAAHAPVHHTAAH